MIIPLSGEIEVAWHLKSLFSKNNSNNELSVMSVITLHIEYILTDCTGNYPIA